MESVVVDTLPIREIARLTGVNTVTLRAWERRYGLIKPLRTNKGHRLYRQEDIALIKKIKTWLARGLAIGKVSELLESGLSDTVIETENIWSALTQQLLSILAEMNTAKLETLLNQLCSVYLAETISDKLIMPVLRLLDQPAFGNGFKKTVLENRTIEYLFMLTQRNRQVANRQRIGIIQLSGGADTLMLSLLHYGLIMNHFRSEMLGVLLVDEIILAQEQLGFDAFIVYNDSITSFIDFHKILLILAQKASVPIFVGGQMAQVLDTTFPAHVHVAANALQTELMALIQIEFDSKNEADIRQ